MRATGGVDCARTPDALPPIAAILRTAVATMLSLSARWAKDMYLFLPDCLLLAELVPEGEDWLSDPRLFNTTHERFESLQTELDAPPTCGITIPYKGSSTAFQEEVAWISIDAYP